MLSHGGHKAAAKAKEAEPTSLSPFSSLSENQRGNENGNCNLLKVVEGWGKDLIASRELTGIIIQLDGND